MQSLLQLRKKLGLNQEAMASLLGTTRSRLSHAEAGRRLLEAPAMQQFALLLKSVNEAPGTHNFTISDEEAESIAFFLAGISFQLTNLLKQHKKQTGLHRQNNLLAHCVKQLSANKQHAGFSTKQKRWIEELHFKSKKALRRSSIETGFFLGLEIRTLQFQKKLCEDFLAGGSFPAEL